MNEQPAPIPVEHPPTYLPVLKSILTQMEKGMRTYGTPLAPFNGRNQLSDAIQECTDLLFYLHNEHHERQMLLEFCQAVVEEYEKVSPMAEVTLPRKFVDSLENLALCVRQIGGAIRE